MKRTLQKTLCILGLCAAASAHASVFDLPSFLPEGDFSVGAEAEIVTSTPTGAGINLKPKYGATSFLNWQGIIGLGSDSRAFRLGTTADFDWFPDTEGGQPGIATPINLLYYRAYDSGVLSYGFSPMIYKTFKGDSASYTPFIALPFGWNLRNGTNSSFMQFAFGSMFKPSSMDSIKFTFEAGFEINQSFSYISGGVTWFP